MPAGLALASLCDDILGIHLNDTQEAAPDASDPHPSKFIMDDLRHARSEADFLRLVMRSLWDRRPQACGLSQVGARKPTHPQR